MPKIFAVIEDSIRSSPFRDAWHATDAAAPIAVRADAERMTSNHTGMDTEEPAQAMLAAAADRKEAKNPLQPPETKYCTSASTARLIRPVRIACLARFIVCG